MLAAVGTAAVLASREKSVSTGQSPAPVNLLVLVTGFVAGVLLHGLLDWLPHSYPIKSVLDVGIALALLAVAMTLAEPRYRLLLGVCALGSMFPDLVDLGPAILNKRFGWSLPAVKIFPWHWRQYSGSIYDGSRNFESLFFHFLVVVTSLGLLYLYRNDLFAQMRNKNGN